jgi:hypothetical protein
MMALTISLPFSWVNKPRIASPLASSTSFKI